MNFTDWAPLKLIDPDLLSRVRLAYVFGNTGQEAVIVTDDDEVLACGKNHFGSLGLGNEEFQMTPVNIPILNKKKVTGFAASVSTSGSFVCAYTYNGMFYYWCKNFTPLNTAIKPIVFLDFHKKVSQVACGISHCSILSTEGEVFCFGNNDWGQLGTGSTNSSSSPNLVQGNLKGKIVTKISCGFYFTACLLDSGTVYAWGGNGSGQIGYSSQSYSTFSNPTQIPDMNEIIIRKIICGSSHVLAINDVGKLFAWGSNDFGQLGLGDTTCRSKPTKIVTLGKVIKIAAVEKTSAAMTENLEVYMWGACGGLNRVVPTKTQFESLSDVFANFSQPRIMYKPLVRHVQLPPIGKSIEYSFGDTETSDLTIVAEGKEILVHKIILKLRSSYFKLLLKEPWVSVRIIKINQNYDGIYAYLQYIYTDQLKATPELALELLKIANEYHDVDLKKMCEKCVRHGINVENVASLYSLALKLGAEKLAQYCVSFAGNHVGDVMKTHGFSEWDLDTYKEFFLECHRQKIFRS